MKHDILQAIAAYDQIIIHRHERPDPDAIGSQVGLATLIRERYPEKNVFVVGDEEPSLGFLANMDELDDEKFEGALVIVCDTANEERISDQRYARGDKLVKIDHHPNEEPYGDIVWVDPSASSTSEMIVDLFLAGKEEGYNLSKESALLLYAGIVGDTGRFRYDNTTPKTLRHVALLLEQGIETNDFYSGLHRRELKQTRLEGYILQHFSIIDGCVGVMKLTSELLAEYDVTANESAAFVNSFSDVEGLLTWVFFVEDGETIRVRLRSKGPVINTVAMEHNGGGHPMAAGAKAKSWEETDKIVEKLRRVASDFRR
ncbi:bifunctional oligoribonuclease/PAP phosphatase NrnA [Halalkalibacterium halodurans]|jgi:phosphoesterase RecJ-like protein|uniref:BH3173 protein n=2 Tax=Halalkalibacterium halodurans TaxID=86665 RepID=Q9K834_HALH5|nr:bifunctional oligoribonuclease/PAP phosphatase NrnA [Halalkalibacterium halodurans]MED3648019.1 bifunctional oligoribonuclease/PAP phosphatase NrnA [Halalkalibacterium halodurans]MED4082155.1 bifunctional oligoribonuclease/PAP phosphatase NrnA [Halalkalibacterium halodurans]MED4084267.1 bifunctional oligoribonuclease/PAP phosphatase NrnA [Halalkalibacterium halodurans]MED4103576.1 bifunctional oligoribonuclease/PAP phosphatase NrnA [Halalkalibacterium halodurans]MED4107543.1 bifunctional ol